MSTTQGQTIPGTFTITDPTVTLPDTSSDILADYDSHTLTVGHAAHRLAHVRRQ
jgi:hypothetical protein